MLCMLLAWLAACTPDASPPLRLATSPWLGTEPLFLARDLGLLDAADVQLIELTDASQVVSALIDGAVDGATVTLAEALRITARHPGFRIVLVADYCDGADVLIAQPDLRGLADLAGKRIGLEDTALSAHVLRRALNAAGLKLGDIHIRALNPDEQARAFERREVEALVSYDPSLSRARALGGRVLFDTTRIPAEISDVVLVRGDRAPDWLAQRTRTLLNGWFSAVDYLNAHPDDAATRMAPRLKLEPAAITAGLTKTHFPDRALNASHLAAEPPGYVAIAERLKATLVETRELDAEVRVDPLFDLELARAVYR